MGKDKKSEIDSAKNFISGLKSSKDVYCQCPSCDFIFSLHSSRLMYGKFPPKDQLSKSERIVKKTLEKLENLQGNYEEDMEEWREKMDDSNGNWRQKVVDLQNKWTTRLEYTIQDSENDIGLLKEKLRHLKYDVAATQKEIIKEKVTRALLSSRSAIQGHIAELFPIFGKTRFNPADLCCLIPTQPVDFVVFNGLFKKNVESITFLDVKKGGASLSPVQKQIRDSISDGKVEFKKTRVNFDKIKGRAKEES